MPSWPKIARHYGPQPIRPTAETGYQYHTVVLVTIIISRRIDRGISNRSVSAVHIVWVMGRIVWTPGQMIHVGVYRIRRPRMPAASICLAGWGCLTRRQTRQALMLVKPLAVSRLSV